VIPSRAGVSEAVIRLNNQLRDKNVIEQGLLEKEFESLERFGVNKNFLGDLIKILSSKR